MGGYLAGCDWGGREISVDIRFVGSFEMGGEDC